jgi:indole-3-glycerol phosphate synthase
LHPNQIHQARLYGADAVLLHAGAVDLATLTTLVRVASSAHVAPVVVVQTPAELEQALAAEALILGLTSPSGTLDLARLEAVIRLVPPQKTLIALDPINSADECAALRGKVDAALVSEAILDASDGGGALAHLARS